MGNACSYDCFAGCGLMNNIDSRKRKISFDDHLNFLKYLSVP